MVLKSEQSIILYAEENEQGDLETPDSVFSPIEESVDLPDPSFEFEEEYFVGAGQKPADLEKGQKVLEGGSIEFKPTQWFELYLLLGDHEENGDTHILTLKEEDYPPSVSLGVEIDDFTRVFRGTTVSSGTIALTAEEELSLDLDFDALDVTLDEAIDEPAGSNFNDDPTFDFNSTASNLQIFGSEFARLNDFEITIERNTSSEYYIEDTDGAFEILYGRPTITFNPTITVTDSEIYEELIDGETEFESSIEFDNGETQLEIELSGCRIREAPHGIPDEGAVEVDLEIPATDIEITFTE